MKKKLDERLFEAEEEILRQAADDLAEPRFSQSELLPRYAALTAQYEKLLRVTRKIFHISDKQGQVLQRHQIEIQNLLDNANQGFFTFDRHLTVDRRYSAECKRIFGAKIAGEPVAALLSAGDAERRAHLASFFASVFELPREEAAAKLRQLPERFDLHDKSVRVECKLIEQPGKKAWRTVVMMILTDITAHLKAQERINYLSYHDKLTSLYNRAYVEELVPKLEYMDALPLSVVMADMNGLKLVNDVFGHQEGDKMLREAARVLRAHCRDSDVVARWGGDEFVILLPRTDAENCARVCARIQEACAEVKAGVIPLSLAAGAATKRSGGIWFAEMLSIAENRMYNDKLLKSREVRKSIIDKLEARLSAHCGENPGHMERVGALATAFALHLGRGEDSVEVKLLQRLAQLHDIGKVAVPAAILGSCRALTLSEWDIVKSHSEIGYRMVQSIGEPETADLVLALRERWDGSGYPCGLQGEAIPVLARLFSVVDAYDTITHDRAYKRALDAQAALQEIERGGGTQFDPQLATQFVDFMRRRQTV